MDEINRQHDGILDSALNELPLAPLPQDITQRVMATVQADQRLAGTAVPVRFRLQFLDITLSMFWSLVLVFTWLAALWWTGSLQVEWLPQAPATLSFFVHLSEGSSTLFFGGVLLVLLEMCLLGLVAVNLLGDRTTVSSN